MRLLLSTLLLLTLGCASIGIQDPTLQIKLSPLPLERGKPALAQVSAPMDAQKVVGTVLVMGSPELNFRKDADKGIWYFYGTIPFSPWVQPGHYKVRVMVFSEHEKPHYAETDADLK